MFYTGYFLNYATPNLRCHCTSWRQRRRRHRHPSWRHHCRRRWRHHFPGGRRGGFVNSALLWQRGGRSWLRWRCRQRRWRRRWLDWSMTSQMDWSLPLPRRIAGRVAPQTLESQPRSADSSCCLHSSIQLSSWKRFNWNSHRVNRSTCRDSENHRQKLFAILWYYQDWADIKLIVCSWATFNILC